MVPIGEPIVTPQDAFHEAAALHLRARLARAAEPPWLHREVARRMAERLPIIRQPPRRWLDWWAHLGGGASLVRAAYPQSQRTAVEPDDALRARSLGPPPSWWSRRRRARAGDAVLVEGDVAPASTDMVWANMMLHFCADIGGVFASWHRVLAADGFLMFSTLGPGTLPELRLLYERERWGQAFYPFADMHDLGDALVHAGFADPVMDQELLTLTWPSAQAALQELRALGSNLHVQRHRGLRTPRWRDRLLQQLERRRDADGRIALHFEVVYGHAVRLRARARVAPVTVVPLQDLRADLARQRSPG